MSLLNLSYHVLLGKGTNSLGKPGTQVRSEWWPPTPGWGSSHVLSSPEPSPLSRRGRTGRLLSLISLCLPRVATPSACRTSLSGKIHRTSLCFLCTSGYWARQKIDNSVSAYWHVHYEHAQLVGADGVDTDRPQSVRLWKLQPYS